MFERVASLSFSCAPLALHRRCMRNKSTSTDEPDYSNCTRCVCVSVCDILNTEFFDVAVVVTVFAVYKVSLAHSQEHQSCIPIAYTCAHAENQNNVISQCTISFRGFSIQ